MLEAFRLVLLSGKTAFLNMVGHFASAVFERDVRGFIDANNLGNAVRLSGVLTGNDKWNAFSAAELFCFPTHFLSESFEVSLIEAMSFALPIIATRWRSIPDIVDDGENGFLVPIRDPAAMASKLERLVHDRALREMMGRSGREKFLREFTLDRYHARMNWMFQAARREHREPT